MKKAENISENIFIFSDNYAVDRRRCPPDFIPVTAPDGYRFCSQ